ncbi:hypothetical protein LCGC14_2489330 [marine sediment metagenome]|uniref:Uncharacterized protein n=1 Tax=marine sediment metagenome TaxID=412755 RepID=A0A0F9BT58_9ZZZZ
MEEKLEQPTETCGLMLTFEGGIAVKINLKATKEEVVETIQRSLSAGCQDLIQFETANPDEEEVFLFDPKKTFVAIIKKEFLMGGRIVSAQLASPGAPPSDFKH